MKGQWRCLVSQNDVLQRSSHCLSIVKHTGYVFGGELKPREPRDNAVHTIDLDAKSNPDQHRVHTVIAPNAPMARVGAASTILGGKLYVFGGRGGVSMTCVESRGSFAVYDTVKGLPWSELLPAPGVAFPEDRSYHAMTSDGQNTIYVHAGCPAKGRLNDLWAFHVPTQQWKQLASASGKGRGGSSIAFSRSTKKLYRMNGFDGETEQGGSIDIYDPAQDKWTSIPFQADGVHGPEPRSVCTLLPVRLKGGSETLVTLFGEGTPSDLGHAGAGRMYGDVWVWLVQRAVWLRVEVEGPSPEPRGWFGADVLADADVDGDGDGDGIIIHGGLQDNNQRLADVWTLQLI